MQANTVKPVDVMATKGADSQRSGHMWPSLEVASKLFDLSSIALAIGACIVFIATAAIVWLGIVKEHHWDVLREHANERIAELTNQSEHLRAESSRSLAIAADAQNRAARIGRETAQLTTDAETQRARAAEAELKLEQLRKAVAPRSITQDQQREITAVISGFADQRGTVIASPSTPEAEWFARGLTAPLLEAGWKMEILPGTATATALWPTGIIVWYAVDLSKPLIFPEKTDAAKPALALVDKLNSLGIEATALPGFQMRPTSTIEITISTK